MFLRTASTPLQLSNVKSLQATYTLTRNWTTIFTSQQHPALVYSVIEDKVSAPLFCHFPGYVMANLYVTNITWLIVVQCSLTPMPVEAI